MVGVTLSGVTDDAVVGELVGAVGQVDAQDPLVLATGTLTTDLVNSVLAGQFEVHVAE